MAVAPSIMLEYCLPEIWKVNAHINLDHLCFAFSKVSRYHSAPSVIATANIQWYAFFFSGHVPVAETPN